MSDRSSDPPVHRDETASVFSAVAPDGGPAVMIVGHEPVAASMFDPWARALLSAAALPGVAPVFQAAREPDGRPMLVVDASGTTLAELLVTAGPLPVAEAHTAGLALAETLARVHGLGLRHGAVCPSTVLSDGSGPPRLAGFDACAPGMARPAGVRNPFGAPEPDPGPAADVYGLAATLYAALGGRPAAGAAPDLYDVPPPLTSLLRTAMSPDPAQRPTAQRMHDELTGLGATENTLPATPLPAAAVGAPVRPVNETVVSINAAVSGAAAAGAATAAGLIAGKALPGAITAAATGKGGVPLLAKAGAWLSAGKLAAIGVGAAVIAAATVVGVTAFAGDEPAKPPPPPMVTAIRDVDFGEATFTDEELGFDVTLQNGATEPYDGGDGSGYRLYESYPPVYADADGDNDLDAMVTLAREGGNGIFTYAYIWLWRDGTAVQIPRTVAAGGRCGSRFDAPEALDGGFRVTRHIAVDIPYCAAPEYTDETVEFAVRDGYPVTVAPAYGAAVTCIPVDYEEKRTISGYEPRIAPDDDAPQVGEPGEFERLEVLYSRWADPVPPWLVVRMTRTDGTVSCGWIRSDGVV